MRAGPALALLLAGCGGVDEARCAALATEADERFVALQSVLTKDAQRYQRVLDGDEKCPQPTCGNHGLDTIDKHPGAVPAIKRQMESRQDDARRVDAARKALGRGDWAGASRIEDALGEAEQSAAERENRRELGMNLFSLTRDCEGWRPAG